MRNLLAFLIVVLFYQTSRGDGEKPLKGLDGVQFSSAIDTMKGIDLTKDRLARRAEDALQKAGILRKGAETAAYPQLSLTIHGGIKQSVVFFVWELQVKEKVEIPANKSYRRTAFQGPAVIWQSSGMMTTNPANMELDLMAQIEKAVNAFIKQWREANPAESATDKIQETKK